jgi:cytochrome bd-type quinol oxidase subunit 2
MFILEIIPMILIYILFSYIILGGENEHNK